MNVSSLDVQTAITSGVLIASDSARIYPSVRIVPSEDDGSSCGPISIGQGAIIRDGAILCSGVKIGAKSIIGHNVVVRANVVVGDGVVISHGTTIEKSAVIGNNVRISAQTHITGYCQIEDDVQIGARVVTINDREMRWGNSPTLVSQIMRKGCKIGSGVTLMAGVEIGEYTFVGAGSLVTRSFPPNVLAFGVPAYIQRDI